MGLHLFISFASFTLVSSLQLISFCTKDETGEILILKNATAPFQYYMPEVKSVGTLDHSNVVNCLPSFGIKGHVVKKPLFYTSPEDRKDNPDRSKFMHVRVRASWDVPGVHDVKKIWADFQEVEDYLRDHPNKDYKLFYEYISDHPHIAMDPKWKKIVVICTDVQDRTLFVKNKKGLYILPEVRYSNGKMRLANKTLAERLLRRYGIYGTIREKLWEARKNEDKNYLLEMVFHAIVYYKRDKGIGYVSPQRRSARRTLKVIAYDRNDRIWLGPENSRKILEPSAYLGAFEEVMSSTSWRLSLKKLREVYPNGIDRIGNIRSTNYDDQLCSEITEAISK